MNIKQGRNLHKTNGQPLDSGIMYNRSAIALKSSYSGFHYDISGSRMQNCQAADTECVADYKHYASSMQMGAFLLIIAAAILITIIVYLIHCK